MAIEWSEHTADWGRRATCSIGGFLLVAVEMCGCFCWAVMHKGNTLAKGMADDWAKCLQYPQTATALLAKAQKELSGAETGSRKTIQTSEVGHLGIGFQGEHVCYSDICSCGRAEGTPIYAG